MTTQNRPYQGYPYVNPIVIDVPSLDPATAAKWANLPRRPVGSPAPKKSECHERPGTSKDSPSNEAKVNWESTREISSQSKKNSADETPVVYIDVPDCGGSSVIERSIESSEESFVQETIFYDPFKDRRIELRGTDGDSDGDDTSCSAASTRHTTRPAPPGNLQMASVGSSSGYTTSPTFGTPTNPNLPAFMSKEAGYYGRQPTPDDGFPLSPIPVTEFPEPPPAYTEFDRVNQPNTGQAASPPRTEVVTTGKPRSHKRPSDTEDGQNILTITGTVTDAASTIRPGSDRKLLQCQHCGQRVHSLVVRESGAFTHILALIFAFLCLIPIVIAIYCTDCCKYKNHYCPNCNQLIGYEIPILCQQMALV